MKTIYHSKNNRYRRRNNIVLVAVGCTVVLILLFTTLFSRAFYGAMGFLTSSLSGTNQGASTFAALFSSQARLNEENAILVEENKLLKTQLADRDMLLKENAQLKAGQFTQVETGRVVARLISKPPFTPFDVLVIDKGESHFIKAGDKVFIGEIWIGNVTQVEGNTSRITLLSNSQTETSVLIGDGALPAIMKGKGGGNFSIVLPQGSRIAEGDMVRSASTSESSYIADISHIENNNDNTLITVLARFPFSMYDVSYVEIIPS